MMPYDSEHLPRILAALKRIRMPAILNEYDLHALVAAALLDGGFDMRHEVTVGRRARIDFMVGNVGIEVKARRSSRTALLRQAGKYLSSDAVAALIIVSARTISLPDRVAGKPVVMLGLLGQWGVSLP